jgi:adenylate cyclase
MEAPSGHRHFVRLSFSGVALWCLFMAGLYFWPFGTLLDRIEWRTVDWRFQLRGEQAPTQPICIVAVDEESIRTPHLGRWPWPRERFAELVDTLQAAGARRIVFDVFFTERDASGGGAASDAKLLAATRRAGNVYHAGFTYQPQGAAPPVPEAIAARAWRDTRVVRAGGLATVAELIAPAGATFPLADLAAAARGFGIANVLDSGDGVYRHLVPLIDYQEALYPSVALAVAADELGVRPGDITVTPGREINLGGKCRIPLDMHGRMLINFIGGSGRFEYVSAAEVLGAGRNGNGVLTPTPLPRPSASGEGNGNGVGGVRAPALQHGAPPAADSFRDKIVLIGVTAPGIYDLRASPFETLYNGVEAEASALECILSQRFLRQPSPLVTAALLLLIVVLFGWLLPRLSTALMTPLALAALAGYPALAVLAFTRGGVLIELANPTLALLGSLLIILLLRLLIEERRRHQVQTILRHFVPPQLVGRLIEEEALETLRGERREISVLFVDLRHFTATAEALAPEETVLFLNRYFALMHEVIWEHEGTLDKYIGDEIMVFFNSPVAQADHARRAVMTAIDMQRRIMGNQAEWEHLQVPDLSAGVGIATGPAVVGYVGSQERMQYTVIGQTVNLASRLQALCKVLGCRILISDETYQAVADLIVAEDLGELGIIGFQQPVRVWQVLDYKEEALRGNWGPVGRPIDEGGGGR